VNSVNRAGIALVLGVVAAGVSGAAVASRAAAPTIAIVSPTHALPGQRITLYGTNLASTGTVLFTVPDGGRRATTDFTAYETRIRVRVPFWAVTGKLQVSSPDGIAESAEPFVVDASKRPPVVTGVEPDHGIRLSIVEIRGTRFYGATRVVFGSPGFPADEFEVLSATRIRVRVPRSAFSGPVTVTTPAGSDSSPQPFTVDAGPVPGPQLSNPLSIESVTPEEARAWTRVTVRGPALRTLWRAGPSPREIKFGDVPVSVNPYACFEPDGSEVACVAEGNDADSLSVYVPACVVSGKVRVTIGTRSASSPQVFTLARSTPPGVQPEVAGFWPESVSMFEDSLLVYGTGLNVGLDAVDEARALFYLVGEPGPAAGQRLHLHPRHRGDPPAGRVVRRLIGEQAVAVDIRGVPAGSYRLQVLRERPPAGAGTGCTTSAAVLTVT